jgi:hypothetical protein
MMIHIFLPKVQKYFLWLQFNNSNRLSVNLTSKIIYFIPNNSFYQLKKN